MAINTGVSCESTFLIPDCHGVMEYSDPLTGGDRDDYGVKEPFCNDCGSGFEHELPMMKKGTTTSFTDLVSNRHFKKVITLLNIRYHKPHMNYAEMQEAIQHYRDIKDRRPLIDALASDYNDNVDFVESQF